MSAPDMAEVLARLDVLLVKLEGSGFAGVADAVRAVLSSRIQAQARIAELESNLDHYAPLLMVEPGAMPEVFWKDRCLASEARIAEMEGALKQARGWAVTCSESAKARADIRRIDAALSPNPTDGVT